MAIGGPDIEGEDRFLRTLGETLSFWQQVEGNAFFLFVALMGKADQRLVSVIFHHIQSFESRVSLLHRCAFFAIPPGKMWDRWDALRKDLEKKTKIRNRLVHFSAGYRHSSEFTGYALTPSHFDATYAINDRWKNPEFQIDQWNLEKFGYEFCELARQIDEFKTDIEHTAKKTLRRRSSTSDSAKSIKRSK